MKAQLVSENIRFQRGRNPLGAMDLGGFSYETLQPGAILQSKKFFGITQSSGQITGYHSGKMSVRSGDYFLVTHIGVPYGKNDSQKTIQFRKSYHLDVLQELREKMAKGESPGWSFSAPSGFLEGITKRKFDYRFDIIEPGFSVNESVGFHRGGDPKRKMGIGEITWQTLKPGDILITKQEFKINKYGTPIPPSRGGGMFFHKDVPLVIVEVVNSSAFSSGSPEARIVNGLKIRSFEAWDIDDALKVSQRIRNGTFEVPNLRRPIIASFPALEKRLEIYQG